LRRLKPALDQSNIEHEEEEEEEDKEKGEEEEDEEEEGEEEEEDRMNNEMGGARDTCRGEEKHVQDFG
jgi:hypothetical protein